VLHYNQKSRPILIQIEKLLQKNIYFLDRNDMRYTTNKDIDLLEKQQRQPIL
jgi:hypothetical protein